MTTRARHELQRVLFVGKGDEGAGFTLEPLKAGQPLRLQ